MKLLANILAAFHWWRFRKSYEEKMKRQLGVTQLDAIAVSVLDIHVKTMKNREPLTSLLERGDKYFFKGDYNQAIASYETAAGIDPITAGYCLVSAYQLRGKAQYDRREYDPAIADFTTIIGMDPNISEESQSIAYQNRGLAYTNEAEYDKAIADFDQVIAKDLEDALAYCRRGNENLLAMRTSSDLSFCRPPTTKVRGINAGTC